MLAITMSATTFHLFFLLPAELQIKILQEASLSDRHVFQKYRLKINGP